MLKFAIEEWISFYKLNIKIKNEIVSYRIPEDEYNMNNIGTTKCHVFVLIINLGAPLCIINYNKRPFMCRIDLVI